MIVNIGESVYEVDANVFSSIRETVVEQKTERYYIYCLATSKGAMFVDEIFKDRKSLLKQVAIYHKRGFRVYYKDGDKK